MSRKVKKNKLSGKNLKSNDNSSLKRPTKPGTGKKLCADGKGPSLPETAKRFILEKFLGSGGMCEVYAALDLRRADWDDPCPRVAVKKLLPEFRNNRQAQLALTQEFAKIRNLSHPGLVKAYDIHQHGDDLYLSMELLKGQTLKEYFAARQSAGNEGLKTAAAFFNALSHIHDSGLVHADIKPGNVFLSPGRLVIFDFNISVAIPQAGQSANSPVQALVKARILPACTTAYAGIERLNGAGPSQADDIFAASCTIYELFSGKHPYKRLSAIEAVDQGQPPEHLKSLGRRQWRYLSAGLNFRPDKRPSANELYNIFAKQSFISAFRRN